MISQSEFIINDRVIGSGNSPYIIAELSSNHLGRIENAIRSIQVAKNCGVDAVKIQSYHPDSMTLDCSKDDFIIKEGLWQGRTLYDLYTEAQTPYDWHERLFEYAKSICLTLFSSPFDESALELLESLNAPAYKIASFEIVDLNFISHVAKTNKPMLISTGMSSMDEIGEAIEAARTSGSGSILLFHCISDYPASLDQMNLANISYLKNEFKVEVGLSDHTVGTTAAIAATALGASAIEKHFILDKKNGGPDSSFSIDPRELSQLVCATKDAYSSIGVPGLIRSSNELENSIFRRSIYFVEDAVGGTVLQPRHIRIIRPANGLEPKYYVDILGKTLRYSVTRGDPVKWENFY